MLFSRVTAVLLALWYQFVMSLSRQLPPFSHRWACTENLCEVIPISAHPKGN